MREIYQILYQLGVTANYRGFYYCADAVWLALEDTRRLSLVTKQLYPEVAKKHDTAPHCVERDIRTVCKLGWKRNRELLMKLANGTLTQEPTVSQFVAILTQHCAQRRDRI